MHWQIHPGNFLWTGSCVVAPEESPTTCWKNHVSYTTIWDLNLQNFAIRGSLLEDLATSKYFWVGKNELQLPAGDLCISEIYSRYEHLLISSLIHLRKFPLGAHKLLDEWGWGQYLHRRWWWFRLSPLPPAWCPCSSSQTKTNGLMRTHTLTSNKIAHSPRVLSISWSALLLCFSCGQIWHRDRKIYWFQVSWQLGNCSITKW